MPSLRGLPSTVFQCLNLLTVREMKNRQWSRKIYENSCKSLSSGMVGVALSSALSSVTSRDEKKHTTRIMCKPRWEKRDRALTNCQLERICYFDTFLPSLNGSIDILEPLGHLNAVLKRATIDSIPMFKPAYSSRDEEQTMVKKDLRKFM